MEPTPKSQNTTSKSPCKLSSLSAFSKQLMVKLVFLEPCFQFEVTYMFLYIEIGVNLDF